MALTHASASRLRRETPLRGEEEPRGLRPAAPGVGEELIAEALLQVLRRGVVAVGREPVADGGRPVGDLRHLGEEGAYLPVGEGATCLPELEITVMGVLNHVRRTDDVAVDRPLEGAGLGWGFWHGCDG